MALPINIENLINGKTVESERIEFKKGWNPLELIQAICAFANDINNWGGGYVVLGIETNNGLPILPPIGIQNDQIDKIQQEMLNLCHELRPYYFPISEAVEFQGKNIFLIWIPGGETRPYKAPQSLSKPRNYAYFVRRFSSTKKANDQEERDLIRMSANVPYDDQIQQNAKITDLSLPLIQAHLAEVGSDLAGRAIGMSFSDLCRRMNIVAGPDEYLKPKNIGLLLFNNNPAAFFPCARIDLVQFKNDVGDQYTEKIFNGAIQQQLRDALVYIKNNVVIEEVKKIPGRAEAVRYYNYPFEAIEEALANTVYHRSYQDDSPIELRIYPDKFEMISYPGPLPPLNKDKLRAGKIVARKYRNRRIGDFLKELRLTEGRGTGIPKIIRAMKINGSPTPIFDTDDNLSYFLTTLPIHPNWVVQDVVQDVVQKKEILRYCLRAKKKREILTKINVYNNYNNFKKHIKSLINKGLLVLTIPDKPSSRNQQYRTTATGEDYINQAFNG